MTLSICTESSGLQTMVHGITEVHRKELEERSGKKTTCKAEKIDTEHLKLTSQVLKTKGMMYLFLPLI